LRPISPQALLTMCVHILLYYIYFNFGAFILTSYLLNRI
jgi:phosphate starvation-inducible membrane PsiE